MPMVTMRYPSPPNPMIAVTVTRPIVVTVAMRRPATMTGSASGSSISQSRWSGRYPRPVAASTVSAGTPSRPSTVFRVMISSV